MVNGNAPAKVGETVKVKWKCRLDVREKVREFTGEGTVVKVNGKSLRVRLEKESSGYIYREFIEYGLCLRIPFGDAEKVTVKGTR